MRSNGGSGHSGECRRSRAPEEWVAAPQRQGMSDETRVLLTGATGYVGGRLLRALEAEGIPLRCLARRVEHLAARVGPGTEIFQGDVLDRASLDRALSGVRLAYYLVHSMGSPATFEEQDRAGARRTSAQAARAAGVRRIIYLGGLGERRAGLSPHLRSRQETGEVLRASGVPVDRVPRLDRHRLGQPVLRDDPGAGGAAAGHDHARAGCAYQAQPIAIEDVLAYLLAALDLRAEAQRASSRSAGRTASRYGDIMREYARQRGLRRLHDPRAAADARTSRACGSAW